MVKYYVYCLKNKGELVYIGSTIKIIDRIRTHKRDKAFDEVICCELPDKETMLEVEAYGISSKKPILNSDKPNFSITQIPDYIKWRRVDLNFLRYADVDWAQNVLVDASYDYIFRAMTELGIPCGLHSVDLCYKMQDGEVIAVFDGSGEPIHEFIVSLGFDKGDQHVEEAYALSGKITPQDYERSINQFN
jgi:hypothetical protein